jgi:hypothetical protein
MVPVESVNAASPADAAPFISHTHRALDGFHVVDERPPRLSPAFA